MNNIPLSYFTGIFTLVDPNTIGLLLTEFTRDKFETRKRYQKGLNNIRKMNKTKVYPS